jgi:5-(aminomethyl)-3-furanmethanol phosphate kinase
MAHELVVKVGGSLFDLPRLGNRLHAWLKEQAGRVLVVPGGGPAADWIRDLDVSAHLGAERSHWLALRAMTLAAHVLAQQLPGGLVVEHLEACETAWSRGQVPILDMHAFARVDEARAGHLDHSWAVTSDSLAARVATVGGFGQLVLLKSRSLPEPIDWAAAAGQGYVDAAFPAVVGSLRVSALNFRVWQPAVSSAANDTTTEP